MLVILLRYAIIVPMLIKELDKNRDVTSTGYVIQRKTGSSKSKPVGSVWLPAKGAKDYRAVMIGGKRFQLHRVIWEAFNGPIPEGAEIDHINGDKADNRLENLRLSCRRMNQRAYRNLQGGSSKYRGVSWYKSAKKWKAQIQHNGKHTHIGYYYTEVAAAFARDLKAIELGWPVEGTNFFATN